MRNPFILAALCLLILGSLPLNPFAIHLAQKADWASMAFFLPVGLALALHFEIEKKQTGRKK
jgi:hypothetical protein